MHGHAALGDVAVGELVHEVLDADVGEGAAHHHFMVAAARAVLVEVALAHLTLGEPLARRRGELDGARGRDVVGGDLVAEQREDARVDHVLDRIGGHGHALEIGRVLHVGGVDAPLEGLARWRLDLAPVGVALEDVGVAFLEDLLGDELLDVRLDFLRRRPDVAQIDGLAVLALAQRLLRQVHVDVAGERVGDNERRRGEIVRLHIGVDATLEVAVARQHGRGDDVVLVDRLGDDFRQRTGVADAGRAAIADQIEADLVEILLQAGVGEVFADNLRARRQRGLHPRLRLQALGDGVARQQAGGDQHARVRGVGARRDGRDDDVAVAEIIVRAIDGEPLMLLGTLAIVGFHRLREARADLAKRQATFGTLRAGHRRHDRAEVELQRVGEHGILGLGGQEHALRLGVFLNQRDTGRLAVRRGEEVDRLGVHGEVTAGRAILGRHVADGGAVGEGQVGDAGAIEFDELADDALLAQHLRDGEHEISGGDALGQLAGELEADDLGQQHRKRLAEHAGLGLDAADAPAENGEAVDHGRVRIGANQRVGIGDLDGGGGAARGLELFLLRPDGLGEIFEVHLMANAGAGGNDREVVEGALAPLEELIALAVALIFQIDVLLERLGGAELIHDNRMVDDQIDRHQRVDAGGLAAELGDGVAHGGQIDHGGNAREILHQHAGGAEGDLLLGLALVDQPLGAANDVFLGHGAPVLEAQQVFKHDLHRIRQARDALQPVLFGLFQRKVMIGLRSDDERLAAFEAVERHVWGLVHVEWSRL